MASLTSAWTCSAGLEPAETAVALDGSTSELKK
jgi:hypothetical protein